MWKTGVFSYFSIGNGSKRIAYVSIKDGDIVNQYLSNRCFPYLTEKTLTSVSVFLKHACQRVSEESVKIDEQHGR
jgi:selenophosphate synthase